ncbi:MFS transporter [Sphingosinicella soli]|uniref:MFS family permease n=1 Tax=Sphingosinicella soli TaxID=333708 RepID=A0A7W7B3N1_9SPHN|nr:MFS transporter [Sphingosinicella soli]MBB4633399.1 MFS family permease [Sphingosinicella soli]
MADLRQSSAPVQHMVGLVLIMLGMSGVAAQTLIFSLPPPILPALAAALPSNGTSVAQFMLTFPSLGLIIGGALSGPIIDRVGLGRTLLVGAIAYGGLGAIPMISADPAMLLATRLGLGGACALLSAASAALLTQLFTDDARRAKFLGYQNAAGALLGVVAVITAGAMARWGWQAPFSLYGAFGLLVGGASLLTPATNRGTDVVPPNLTQVGKRLASVLPLAALLFIVPIAIAAQVPFLLIEKGVSAPLLQAVIIGAFTVGSVIGSLTFGRASRIMGGRRAFAIGIATTAVGFVGIVYSDSATAIGVASVVTGIGSGFSLLNLYLLTAQKTSDAERPRAYGLLGAAFSVGSLTNPPFMGGLAAAFGLAGSFLSFAAILTLAALFLWRWK